MTTIEDNLAAICGHADQLPVDAVRALLDELNELASAVTGTLV